MEGGAKFGHFRGTFGEVWVNFTPTSDWLERNKWAVDDFSPFPRLLKKKKKKTLTPAHADFPEPRATHHSSLTRSFITTGTVADPTPSGTYTTGACGWRVRTRAGCREGDALFMIHSAVASLATNNGSLRSRLWFTLFFFFCVFCLVVVGTLRGAGGVKAIKQKKDFQRASCGPPPVCARDRRRPSAIYVPFCTSFCRRVRVCGGALYFTLASVGVEKGDYETKCHNILFNYFLPPTTT